MEDAPKGKPVVRLSNHTATMTALPAAIVSSAREDLGEYSSTAADDICAHPAIANAKASVVEMSACRGTIPKWITVAPAAMAASSVVMSCCGPRDGGSTTGSRATPSINARSAAGE